METLFIGNHFAMRKMIYTLLVELEKFERHNRREGIEGRSDDNLPLGSALCL